MSRGIGARICARAQRFRPYLYVQVLYCVIKKVHFICITCKMFANLNVFKISKRVAPSSGLLLGYFTSPQITFSISLLTPISLLYNLCYILKPFQVYAPRKSVCGSSAGHSSQIPSGWSHYPYASEQS